MTWQRVAVATPSPVRRSRICGHLCQQTAPTAVITRAKHAGHAHGQGCQAEGPSRISFTHSPSIRARPTFSPSASLSQFLRVCGHRSSWTSSWAPLARAARQPVSRPRPPRVSSYRARPSAQRCAEGLQRLPVRACC
jgi:hypothetical protein